MVGREELYDALSVRRLGNRPGWDWRPQCVIATVSDEISRLRNEQVAVTAARVSLIERSILVLLMVGLIIGVLAIVRPFITAILFGRRVLTACWPARQALVRRGISHGTAAALCSWFRGWTHRLASALRCATPCRSSWQRHATVGDGTSQPHQSNPTGSRGSRWLVTVLRRHGIGWSKPREAYADLRTVRPGDLEQAMIGPAHALADSVLQRSFPSR